MVSGQKPRRLEAKIRQAAAQYAAMRMLRAWLRFGLFSVLVVIGFTALSFGLTKLEITHSWMVWALLGAELLGGLFFVYRPLRKPVSLEQIALHMEETTPELENRLISAVEFQEGKDTYASPWLVEKFYDESEAYTKRLTFQELLDSDQVLKLFLGSTFVFLLALAIVFGFYSQWVPERPQTETSGLVAEAVPDFSVEPGNARVRQGDNQVVVAKLGQAMSGTSIRWREEAGEWQSKAMETGNANTIFYFTFNSIQNDIEYQVQAGELRSDIYKIDMWLPPKVEAINLTYTYPEYLKMEPKEVPNGGDITAVEGTRVKIAARVNKEMERAALKLKSGEEIALQKTGDLEWAEEITITKDDEYSIPLKDTEGEISEFDPTYDIKVQPDLPPKIQVKFPQQDIEVTMLEEVPFEFQVSDDYGLTGYGLQYQVAGREPVRVPLSATGTVAAASGQTAVALEKISVLPSDLITWTVWAEDSRPDRNEMEEMGDPYFIEVRPYKRSYQEAISNQGGQQMGGQQGGQQGQNNEASSQKDLIIATWNLRRKAKDMSADEFNEKKAAIIEGQKTLQERTSEEAAQSGSTALLPQVMEAMNQAVEALEKAEHADSDQALGEATAAQQKAYNLILKMKPELAQVQQQQGQQGGGGGGGDAQQQEINELELNRNENFYEQESQTQQQEQMQQTQEALNKLQDLIQRQSALHEEIAKLISEQQNQQMTPEERKRQLERLQEEERRNLERLDELERQLASGDMRNEQTQQALQNLQEVREQLNRSLEQLSQEELQDARSASSRALSSMNEANQELQQDSREASAQRMDQLQQQMNELTQKQQSIIDQLEAIQKEQESPSLSLEDNSEQRKEEIKKKKEELSQEVLELLEQAASLEENSRSAQPLLSRKLGDWLRQTSQKGIVEDIQSEEDTPLIQYGIWDEAIKREEQILEKMRQAQAELDKVGGTAVQDDIESMQLALQNIREMLDAPQEGGLTPQNELRTGRNRSGQIQDATGTSGRAIADASQASGSRAQNSDNPEGMQGLPQSNELGTNPNPLNRSGAGMPFDPTQQPQANSPNSGSTSRQQGNEGQPGQNQQGQQQRQQGQQGQEGSQQGQQQGQGQQGQQQGSQSGQLGQGQQQSGQQQGGQQQGQQGQGQGQQQSGQQQGQQQGGQQSGQQGGGQGQGNGQRIAMGESPETQGNAPAQPQGSAESRESNQWRPGGNRGTNSGPGGFDIRDFTNMTPEQQEEFMRRLMERDVRQWTDRMDDTMRLLPESDPSRGQVEQAQEQLQDLYRGYRNDWNLPQYDLFLEKIAKPLAEAAALLDEEIQRKLSASEFLVQDEGRVPSVYQESVARYFQSLSESETAP